MICVFTRRDCGAGREIQGDVERRGKIPDTVKISERPAEIGDCMAPGSWRGDLIVHVNHSSAEGILVEHTGRFSLLLLLGNGDSAKAVARAVLEATRTDPRERMSSVTRGHWTEKSTASHLPSRPSAHRIL